MSKAAESLGEAMGNGGYVSRSDTHIPEIWDDKFADKMYQPAFIKGISSWDYQGMGERYSVPQDDDLRYVSAIVSVEHYMDNLSDIDKEALVRARLGVELATHIGSLSGLVKIEKRGTYGYHADEYRAEVVVMTKEKLQIVIRKHAEEAYTRGHDQGKEDHFNDGYNEGLNTERE